MLLSIFLHMLPSLFLHTLRVSHTLVQIGSAFDDQEIEKGSVVEEREESVEL